ncbi:MAG: TlyA family RNA methyltransferase [Christensenellaceae bacterium]
MRLDSYLYENGYYSSRTKSQEAVLSGAVTVNGKTSKPSFEVDDSDVIKIIQAQKFVSMGGYKLEKALCDFNIGVEGLVCCDIGASTGGFTDCLLQRGAKKVYCVDVGKTQLDNKLKNDERVVVKDYLNARNLENNSFEPCDLAVCDCSFISLKLVLMPIFNVIKQDGMLIALIKPQFECLRNAKSKRGIVGDRSLQLSICCEVYDFAVLNGLVPIAFTNAPIRDKKNNEYLMCFAKTGKVMNKDNLKTVVFRKEKV